jgi:uroporphyrinogen-III synthase
MEDPYFGRSLDRLFDGLRVVSFESRRSAEMASLITRHGGVSVAAPAMREVVLTENAAALDFARALAAGSFDAVVLMTGVGTRALCDEVSAALDRAGFAEALARVPRLVARGPKPAAVLRELGVARERFVIVPEPNTWREVRGVVLSGPRGDGPLRVAVQEHGAPSDALYEALRAAGAEVTPVAAYKWALPEDTAPLRAGIRALARGEARVALFTSRAQVEHAFAVAAEEGVDGALREALARGVVCSIGPVCGEALRAEGLTPDITPEHGKMGHLVKAAAERARAVLDAKEAGRGASGSS